ncbi:DUF5363 family protein [Ferrimonas marina]|uniref:Uncharacterized protein n=1 Tax=Ferrimonas marina TaxID=299255 RepID=A0A1M5VAP6_9GAMM|nr:DUF5363 family protein [Ferrimonas marina]SHH72003.1 hypothetical protein SAMN02745129_2666 [Ferrimonas marina]
MRWIKALWAKYCQFLDSLGLTPESKRCCVPLSERAQEALKRGEQPDR